MQVAEVRGYIVPHPVQRQWDPSQRKQREWFVMIATLSTARATKHATRSRLSRFIDGGVARRLAHGQLGNPRDDDTDNA